MAGDKGLDEEFKRIMSDMKPHTKILPYKSGALGSDSNRYPPDIFTAQLLSLATTCSSFYACVSIPSIPEERHRVTLWIKKLLGLKTHK